MMWELERYARFTGGEQQLFSGGYGGTQSTQADGNWRHYSSTSENIIQLALVDVHYLTITCGSDIYERVSLWESKKWLRIIRKGDSALFIIKNKEHNRRFRVKFSSTSSGVSSADACKQCLSALSPIIPVSDMSGGGPVQPSTDNSNQAEQNGTRAAQTGAAKMLSSVKNKSSSQERRLNVTATPLAHSDITKTENFKTIKEMATILGGSSCLELTDAYKSTNLPTDQLQSFITLCLTDSNFPGFVEAVDKTLQDIIEN